VSDLVLSYYKSQGTNNAGPIVRLAPNEVSFATVGAQNTIYNCPPDDPKTSFTKLGPNQTAVSMCITREGNVISTGDYGLHKKLKSVMGSALTSRAVAKQEPITQCHVRKLFQHLDVLAKDPEAVVNIGDHVSNMIWDTVSDLSFGEPLSTNEKGITPFHAIFYAMLIYLDIIDSIIINAGTFMVIFDSFCYALPFSSRWIHLVSKPLGTLLELIPYPLTLGYTLKGSQIRK
jgi:hypothetical protein